LILSRRRGGESFDGGQPDRSGVAEPARIAGGDPAQGEDRNPDFPRQGGEGQHAHRPARRWTAAGKDAGENDRVDPGAPRAQGGREAVNGARDQEAASQEADIAGAGGHPLGQMKPAGAQRDRQPRVGADQEHHTAAARRACQGGALLCGLFRPEGAEDHSRAPRHPRDDEIGARRAGGIGKEQQARHRLWRPTRAPQRQRRSPQSLDGILSQ